MLPPRPRFGDHPKMGKRRSRPSPSKAACITERTYASTSVDVGVLAEPGCDVDGLQQLIDDLGR